MLIDISPAELNTILLGLRVVQFASQHSVAYLGDKERLPEVLDMERFADYGEPLSTTEIDGLCEKINFGPEVDAEQLLAGCRLALNHLRALTCEGAKHDCVTIGQAIAGIQRMVNMNNASNSQTESEVS